MAGSPDGTFRALSYSALAIWIDTERTVAGRVTVPGVAAWAGAAMAATAPAPSASPAITRATVRVRLDREQRTATRVIGYLLARRAPAAPAAMRDECGPGYAGGPFAP